MARDQIIDLTGGDGWDDHSQLQRAEKHLIGRKVMGIIDDLPTKDPGWAGHGGISIVFDDNSVLEISAWGHDAWGPILELKVPRE